MYFSIVAVWFLVSIPLTFVGGYMAVRMPIKDNPVKTNQIPRHIPPPPLAANPIMLFFAGMCKLQRLFVAFLESMSSCVTHGSCLGTAAKRLWNGTACQVPCAYCGMGCELGFNEYSSGYSLDGH